jgi:hypothetical protein
MVDTENTRKKFVQETDQAHSVDKKDVSCEHSAETKLT